MNVISPRTNALINVVLIFCGIAMSLMMWTGHQIEFIVIFVLTMTSVEIVDRKYRKALREIESREGHDDE